VQPRWSKLSLAEWVVLCLVSEKPTHSFAIASLLAKDGALGQVWHVPKAVAYRSAARLVQLGLITAAEKQPSHLGPARSQLEVTAKGEQAARDWLRQPVTHPRDIRSELLVKLALLGRVNSDPGDLLQRQRAQLVPIADALAAEAYAATEFDHMLALWRHESVSATLRFVDDLLAVRTAAEMMLTAPARHPLSVTVGEIRDFFRDDHVHAALVVSPAGHLQAVVERDDIAGCQPLDAAAAPLGQLAGRTVPPEANLAEVGRVMTATGRRRAAVISADGRLLGLLCLKASRAGFCSDQDVRARARGEIDRAAVGHTAADWSG
jgi:DNA-binding PadR family transcriptional regulator